MNRTPLLGLKNAMTLKDEEQKKEIYQRKLASC